jgi:cob(I)alamin adenosyltransferase
LLIFASVAVFFEGKGMILVYTGPGKGKTSACVGQAIRAHGQGLRVCFAQFMKQPNQAGEQKVLAGLLGHGFYTGGKGFFRKEADRARHRQAALDTLRWVVDALPTADLLVLDESLYALGNGLLLEEEVRRLIELARQENTHLVLSGRGLPDWLRQEADLITEMLEIKHPFVEGHMAAKGIEF